MLTDVNFVGLTADCGFDGGSPGATPATERVAGLKRIYRIPLSGPAHGRHSYEQYRPDT